MLLLAMLLLPMLLQGSVSMLSILLLLLQGSVSILSHSLGSVLCFDVLCNQPPGAYVDLLPHSFAAAAWPGGGAAAGWEGGAAALGAARCGGGGGVGGAGRGQGEELQWLQAEVERLRAENQRLQLQLELAGPGRGAALGASLEASPAAPPPAAAAAGGAAASGGAGGGGGGSGSSSATPMDIDPWGGAAAGAPADGGRAGGSAGGKGDGGGPMATSGAGASCEVLVEPLAFRVDVLCTIGSPLGCFLAMRVSGGGAASWTLYPKPGGRWRARWTSPHLPHLLHPTGHLPASIPPPTPLGCRA